MSVTSVETTLLPETHTTTLPPLLAPTLGAAEPQQPAVAEPAPMQVAAERRALQAQRRLERRQRRILAGFGLLILVLAFCAAVVVLDVVR